MINSRLDGLPMTYSSWISFYDRSRYVIFFAVFLFLSFQNTNAQVISTTAGGNWNAGATWIGGIVPAVGQDVVIDGPVSLNVNTPSIASLTINSGDTRNRVTYEKLILDKTATTIIEAEIIDSTDAIEAKQAAFAEALAKLVGLDPNAK